MENGTLPARNCKNNRYFLPLTSVPIGFHHVYCIWMIEFLFLTICFLLTCTHFSIHIDGYPTGPGVTFALTLLEIFIGFGFLAVLSYGIRSDNPFLVGLHFHAEISSIPILLVNGLLCLAAVFSSFDETVVYGSKKPGIIITLAYLSLLMVWFECYSIPTMRRFAMWFYEMINNTEINNPSIDRKIRAEILILEAQERAKQLATESQSQKDNNSNHADSDSSKMVMENAEGYDDSEANETGSFNELQRSNSCEL